MSAPATQSSARTGFLIGLLVGLAAVPALTWVVSAAFRADDVDAPAADVRTPNPSSAEAEEQLMALGYTSGSVEAPAVTGLTKHDPENAFQSLNLYTSAHAPEAYLMDMDGRILHRWGYPFEKLWPNVEPEADNVSYWRRVHVFENGDILAIIEPHGIFRVDKDSKLLWENHCGAHHDLYVAPDGHIFVLARTKQMVEWGGKPRPILEEYVLELDESGKELRRVSLTKALRNTEYRSLLEDAPPHWDITHSNALKRIQDGVADRIPAFQAGRFLVSLREIDTVAVLDLDDGLVHWALKGQWHRQHESTMLDSGNILLFDNRGNGGRSKVIEVDPVTQQIVWSYGLRENEPLDSSLCGLAARLPNGNTLITEAIPGRVFEVTPDGAVVWEYINPNLAQEAGRIIATLMHFERLPVSFTPRWLGGAAPVTAGES